MAKKENKEKLPTDIVALPVYMLRSVYDDFNRICKGKRQAMTKVAEAEIVKLVNKETRTV